MSIEIRLSVWLEIVLLSEGVPFAAWTDQNHSFGEEGSLFCRAGVICLPINYYGKTLYLGGGEEGRDVGKMLFLFFLSAPSSHSCPSAS